MQQEIERWTYAEFLPMGAPDRLGDCPVCGRFSERGYALLREARVEGGACYSVYCRHCDRLGPQAADMQAAIEAWKRMNQQGVAAARKPHLMFGLSL